MELTPLDIKNQEFRKKTFGGLDPEEVSAFLRQVASVFETLSRNRNECRERITTLEERIGYYKQIEKTLQDSAVTMQKTLDESRANARKEAELIIAEAKAEADRETDRVRKHAESLKSEISALENQRKNYFIRIRSLIHAQEDLLNAMEESDIQLPGEKPSVQEPKEEQIPNSPDSAESFFA